MSNITGLRVNSDGRHDFWKLRPGWAATEVNIGHKDSLDMKVNDAEELCESDVLQATCFMKMYGTMFVSKYNQVHERLMAVNDIIYNIIQDGISQICQEI
ncbi:hypothetical protein BsWGS_18071 [Bradybaena similaris]